MDPVFKEALAMTKEAAKAQVDLLEAGSKVGAHTPGPWEADMTKPRNPMEPNVMPSYSIRHYSGDSCLTFAYLVANESDARLIAAAPELAEALRPIAAAYRDDPGTSDLYDEQPVSITLGDVRRVWKALAKLDTDSTK